jgi:L-malate glycosyltransferase
MSRDLGGGGSQRQLVETARGLDRTLFEPHVGCFFAEGLRVRELSAANIALTEFPVRSFKSPSMITVARQLGAYIRDHRIRIVHTFDVPAAIFGVFVARWYKTLLVLSSMRASRALTSDSHRRMLRLTDRVVDAVVVNCRAVEQEMIEQDGTRPEKIHLCYNAIDTKRFKSELAREQRENLTVGSTSMLRPEKGVDTLIEAFAQLRTPGVRLLLIGDGPEQAALEARVQALGIGDRVRFAGAAVDTAPYLHQIDIFVLPSHSEALSNSLMEAMGCGCAVVASRVGGNPELVSHGHTGLLFKVGDAADLATQLECLVKDAPLRRLVAGAGARRIHTEFSIDASIRRFQELYLSLLAAG